MLVIIPSYERFRQSGDIPKEQDRIFELLVKHLSVVSAISSAPLFESFLGDFQGVNLLYQRNSLSASPFLKLSIPHGLVHEGAC